MDERGEKLEKLYERPLSASWALNGKGRVHIIHIEENWMVPSLVW